MDWKKDAKRIDEGRFKCKGCQEYKTLRHGSCFEGTRKSLVVYYRVIFCGFANHIPQTSLSSSLGLSRSLINKIYQFCRKVVSEEEVFLRERVPLGSFETVDNHIFREAIIEADETLLTHHSQVDDIYQSQMWAVGLYERGTKDFRVLIVGHNRNEDKLRQIFADLAPYNPNIQQRVLTDGWRGYRFLEDVGYIHDVVHHNQGFGSGRLTTNHIENLWSRIKSVGSFNKGWRCNSLEQAQLQVDEVCWRLRNSEQNQHQNLAILLCHTSLKLIENQEQESSGDEEEEEI